MKIDEILNRFGWEKGNSEEGIRSYIKENITGGNDTLFISGVGVEHFVFDRNKNVVSYILIPYEVLKEIIK